MTPDERKTGTTGLATNAISLLTREAGRVPMVELSVGLQAWQRTRGARAFALRRSNEALQIAAHTPLGRFLPQPAVNHDIAAEAERIATAGRSPEPTSITRSRPKPPARPTPVAPAAPPAAAVAAGAPGVVTDKVEKVTEQLHIDEPTSREDLPIPDFDNVSLGSLRARLRSLALTDLVTLREWE